MRVRLLRTQQVKTLLGKKLKRDPGPGRDRLAAGPLAGDAADPGTNSIEHLEQNMGALALQIKRRISNDSHHRRLLCAPGLARGAAQAQDYPDKPIRIIVGYAAGGGNDIIVRVMQPELQKGLGQPVIVENKPGAQSIIAAETVAARRADGYTLLMGPSGPMTINPATYSKLPLRRAARFHADLDDLRVPAAGHGRRQAADPQREGADRLREGESRQGELRLERRHLPDHHRDVQPADRQQVRDDPVQEQRRIGAGADLRQRRADDRRSAARHRAAQGRHDPRPRRHLAASAIRPGPTCRRWPKPACPTWKCRCGPRSSRRRRRRRAIVARLQKEIARAVQTAEVKERFGQMGLDPVGGTSEELAQAGRAATSRSGAPSPRPRTSGTTSASGIFAKKSATWRMLSAHASALARPSRRAAGESVTRVDALGDVAFRARAVERVVRARIDLDGDTLAGERDALLRRRPVVEPHR